MWLSFRDSIWSHSSLRPYCQRRGQHYKRGVGPSISTTHVRYKKAEAQDLIFIDPHISYNQFKRMLVRIHWLSSLLFVASATALISTTTSHHSTSTTGDCATPTTSTHHTSSTTTKKTTTSTHHTTTSTTKKTTTTSTKSSTVSPTSTPSTFYLVAADTNSTAFDGSYFKIILDPFPAITPSGDSVIQFANKTPPGAANFTLLADGTLQCNSPSGPLVACVSNGHPETQSFMFENPDDLDEWGFVTIPCAITGGVLSCSYGPLVDFLYSPSKIQDGKQVGEYALLALPSDGSPFTIRVVPT